MLRLKEYCRLYDLMDKTKKKVEYLSKKYDKRFNEFFYESRLVAYSYGEPVMQLNCWNDLLSDKYFGGSIMNKSFYPTFEDDIVKYKKSFDDLAEARRQYWVIFKKYCCFSNSLKSNIDKIINAMDDKEKQAKFRSISDSEFKNLKYSPGTKLPSTGESLIMNFLDKIAHKYNFFYFYKHKWSCCKNTYVLEYDFFCVMLYYDHVIQFVIEYDGEQHREENSFYDLKTINTHDVLKQYYLAQLNFHLLRLDNDSSVGKSIIEFINKILSTNSYVITNKIDPIPKYFNDKSDHKGLNHFCEHHDSIRKKYAFTIKAFYSKPNSRLKLTFGSKSNSKPKLGSKIDRTKFELLSFDVIDSVKIKSEDIVINLEDFYSESELCNFDEDISGYYSKDIVVGSVEADRVEFFSFIINKLVDNNKKNQNKSDNKNKSTKNCQSKTAKMIRKKSDNKNPKKSDNKNNLHKSIKPNKSKTSKKNNNTPIKKIISKSTIIIL
jgi:Family of unknown function (DUF5889)